MTSLCVYRRLLTFVFRASSRRMGTQWNFTPHLTAIASATVVWVASPSGRHRKPCRQPYSWLGAGALSLGLGLGAVLAGAPVAQADTGSPVSGSDAAGSASGHSTPARGARAGQSGSEDPSSGPASRRGAGAASRRPVGPIGDSSRESVMARSAAVAPPAAAVPAGEAAAPTPRAHASPPRASHPVQGSRTAAQHSAGRNHPASPGTTSAASRPADKSLRRTATAAVAAQDVPGAWALAPSEAASAGDIGSAVKNFIDSSYTGLNTLPRNAVTEFLKGGLLLIRRALFPVDQSYYALILSGSSWAVPLNNQLSYGAVTSTGFSNPFVAGDQTTWGCRLGTDGCTTTSTTGINVTSAPGSAITTFIGSATGQSAIGPTVLAPSYFSISGAVSPSGAVSMTFNPTDDTGVPTGAPATVGFGQLETWGWLPKMVMQMITGDAFALTHWANMVPFSGP